MKLLKCYGGVIGWICGAPILWRYIRGRAVIRYKIYRYNGKYNNRTELVVHNSHLIVVFIS